MYYKIDKMNIFEHTFYEGTFFEDTFFLGMTLALIVSLIIWAIIYTFNYKAEGDTNTVKDNARSHFHVYGHFRDGTHHIESVVATSGHEAINIAVERLKSRGFKSNHANVASKTLN